MLEQSGFLNSAERHKWLDKLDMETIIQGIQELRQKQQTAPEDNL